MKFQGDILLAPRLFLTRLKNIEKFIRSNLKGVSLEESMRPKIMLVFILIILIILPSTSSAETMNGFPLELVNGSGSFTWNSQNFPALRNDDAIEIIITNNTIKSGDLVYRMNSYPITDLFSEVLPSSASYGNSAGIPGRSVNLMMVVNFLFNRYYIGHEQKLYTILINTNNYKLHDSDKIVVKDYISLIQEVFDIEGSGQAMIGNLGITQDQVILFKTYRTAYSEEPELWIYPKRIANKETEIQGIFFVSLAPYAFSTPISTSVGNTFGKLKITKNWLNDCCSTKHIELINYEDISISGSTISIADNFNLLLTSNSLYPSANVNRKLEVEFVPYATPIPTTPIQTPTPTITITSTSTPTPSPTITSTVTPTITPTSTPTVNPSVIPTPTITQITTPTPTSTSALEQEVKELKERLNKTEEKQSQQESRISWLESMVDSITGWLKSIF